MDDEDHEEVDEYESAKKLVQRAADREALLRSARDSSTGTRDGGGGGGSPDQRSGDEDDHDRGRRTVGSDFSSLALKPDHPRRPCWTCPDGTIYLEAFHDLYPQAYEFLVAIAEPVARPEYVHEYKLTPYSLYAAVATNIDTESIVRVLNRFSKNALPAGVAGFVRECTKRYGKAKLVLKNNRYHVESEHPDVLRELLRDDLISQARVADPEAGGGEAGGGGGGADGGKGGGADGFAVHTKAEEMEENLRILRGMDGDSSDDEEEGGGGANARAKTTTVSFQVTAHVATARRKASAPVRVSLPHIAGGAAARPSSSSPLSRCKGTASRW